MIISVKSAYVKLRIFIFAVIVLLNQLSFVCAWGSYGHRVIAAIADRYLTPETKQKVSLLLGQRTRLADAAEWATEMRSLHPETAPWHYVNIPKDREVYNQELDCPEQGCVVTAIERFTAVLADPRALKSERTKALKFLVHLVGDVHQPLHCGYPDDKGGNTIGVFLKRGPISLHQAWDTDILELRKAKYPLYAAQLCKDLTDSDIKRYQKGTIFDWVAESRVILRESVYTFKSNQILDREYLDHSRKVIDLQILKAGVRLAGLLNAALGD